jgi:hypothetical protein
MAIIKTTLTNSLAGPTEGLYAQVQEYTGNKDASRLEVPVKYFTDEAQTIELTEFSEPELLRTYVLDLSATIDTKPVKEAIYDELGVIWKAAGFAPKGDGVTEGVWVAY